MANKHDEEAILRRLRELEEENARLREVAKEKLVKLVVTEGDYKGHPILTFDGSVRRFTLGLTKLRALKEAWPIVESFLQRHSGISPSETHVDDDCKI